MLNKDTEISQIDGIEFVGFDNFIDGRGQFTEWFRTEWFPQCNWDKLQLNDSLSKEGTLRGMHYHFNQFDYWYVNQGALLVVLYDFRINSPTEGNIWTGFLNESTPMGIFIPPGVVHGFYCVENATLLYAVNNYFNGADEHGINWDDPVFNEAFPPTIKPTISEKDAKLPNIKLIPVDQRPVYNE